jgi:hypothetical protein
MMQQCGDNRRVLGIRSGFGANFAIRREMREALVKPTSGNITSQEFWIAKDTVEKRRISHDAGDRVLPKRSPEAGDGFCTVATPSDKFSEQRIVVAWHGEACVHTVIQADARA